ncbi:MAG: VCBS repeat-containing protein [Deltaproteobacteria bacterium]|nr:VCBS repeat-containing protein [Deltaproteobacteria bacterium]
MPPKRASRALPVLWSLSGVALWALALCALALLAEPRVGVRPAWALAAAALVASPLGLTALLLKALRRVEPGTTLLRNAPGMAALVALLALAGLGFGARGPLADALEGAPSRHPSWPSFLRRGVLALGARLRPAPPPPPPRRPLPVRDGGAAVPSSRDASPEPDAQGLAGGDAAARYDAMDAAPPDATDAPTAERSASDAAPADAPLARLASVTVCDRVHAVIPVRLREDQTDSLVVSCSDGVHVLWFQGVSGLLFERTRVVLTPPPTLEAVTAPAQVWDVDQDGHPDLVLCAHWTTQRGGTRGGGVWWARGLASGQFAPLARLVPDFPCGAVAVGAVSAPRVRELLVADYGNPYQENHPNGALRWYARVGSAWVPRGRLEVRPMPYRLRILDVDGDGHNDVVVHHDDDGTLVARGGPGGPRALDPALHAEDPLESTAAAVDLDGDQAPDWVASSTSDGSLELSISGVAAPPTTLTRALDYTELTLRR